MVEMLADSAQAIQEKRNIVPKIGIVLGSGLGAFIDEIEEPTIIPYDEIPHFNKTSVEGHSGRLILGKKSGVDIAVLQGRLHAYEGLSMDQVVFPIRVLATLGVEVLILTNAAGGVNESYEPGDLVLIQDHINLQGKNPLIGPNINELGPRFPDMTNAYDLGLQETANETATQLGIDLKKGIYCSVLGPTYETPAEVRMIRTLGADMVGMSTVPESIAANHLGLKVLGISCITNLAAGMTAQKLDHGDIKDTAFKVMEKFKSLLVGFIKNLK
jgi:purine-nucleoside phosphorylase